MKSEVLTKSKYCNGLECVKRHWLDHYKPTSVEALSQMQADMGKEIGEMAREYFRNPPLVTWAPQHEVMVQATRRLMEDGNECIAEASFMVGNLFCSVDILRKTEKGWDLIEVKSGTKITDRNENDVAFQLYVLEHAGVSVDHVYLMHVNGEYIRGEGLDLDAFFVLEDVTDKARARFGDVYAVTNKLERTLWDEEPVVPYGKQCDECPYYGYCFSHIEGPSVLDIRGYGRVKRYEYLNKGIITFQELIASKEAIPKAFHAQVETEAGIRGTFCDKEAICEHLADYSYPMYFLDFETYNPGVPPYPMTKPYQQIPFQYSLHVQKEPYGTLEHYEFLAEPGADPRRALAEQLCHDIPKGVCIVSYNAGFEKSRIKELVPVCPDLEEHLMDIHDHMVDQMVPFRRKYFYCKELEGSYSIKYVLPALCPGDPELDYKALDGVHNGAEAISAFYDMASMDEDARAKMRQNLLAYCKLDTLAMVKVHEKLVEMCE